MLLDSDFFFYNYVYIALKLLLDQIRFNALPVFCLVCF